MKGRYEDLDSLVDKLVDKKLPKIKRQKNAAWKFAEMFGIRKWDLWNRKSKPLTKREIAEVLFKNKLVKKLEDGLEDAEIYTNANSRLFINRSGAYDNYFVFTDYEKNKFRLEYYKYLSGGNKGVKYSNEIPRHYYLLFAILLLLVITIILLI